MNVLENFMVQDYTVYTAPEERENRRDRVRAELIRYNEKSNGSDYQNTGLKSTADYIEPTNDGYPGLEPPIG